MRKLRDAVKAKASAVVTKTREVVRSVVSRLSKNRIAAPVVKAARVVVDGVAAIVVALLTLVLAVAVLALVAVLLLLDAVVLAVHKTVTLVYIAFSALLGLIRDRKHFRDELDHGWVVIRHWSIASYLEANAFILARDAKPVDITVEVRPRKRSNPRLSFGGPEAVGA